jgi:peptidoglycan hydrolase-like protein with peptidoglycan-binding domain
LVFARHFFIALVLALAALTSACQSPSSQYLMNGIGAGLPAPDMARAAATQNAYFNYLCQQAGLTEGSFSQKPGDCQVQALDEGAWTLIVRQGMNDIDRRCDAYLEWLDNKQRSRGPLLAQVRDVQETVKGVMFAIDPGSTAALQIVGLAFGLINRSIENYNSRLILAIEPSTRNSVVLNALRRFRQQVKEQKLRFSSRPDAEYALREYMRRCLPFAIESEINDLSTLGSQGISPERATTIFEAPVGMTTGSSAASPSEKVVFVGRVRQGIKDENNNIVDPIGDAKIATWIQEALCVKADGVFGSETREAIAEFEVRAHINVAESNRINGDLDPNEENDLLAMQACPPEFKNFTERIELATTEARQALHDLLKARDQSVPDSTNLSDLRPFIQKWRDDLGLNKGKPARVHNQVTMEFLNKIEWSD